MRPENVSQEAPPLVVPQSVVTSKLANGSGKLEKALDSQSSKQSAQPVRQTSPPPRTTPLAETEVSPKTPHTSPASTSDVPRQPSSTISQSVPRTDASGMVSYAVAAAVVFVIILIALFNRPSDLPSNGGTGAGSTAANAILNQANSDAIPQNGSSAPTIAPALSYSSTPAETPQTVNARASAPPATAAPEESFEIMVGSRKYRVPQIRFEEIENARQAIAAQASRVNEFTSWLETERKNLVVLQRRLPLMNADEVNAWNQRVQTYNTTATQSRAVRKTFDQLTDDYNDKIKRYGTRIR
jgi:hypothetical protein